MLQKLDVLEACDVKPFELLFKQLDKDGSGLLTHVDIDMARKENEVSLEKLERDIGTAMAFGPPAQAVRFAMLGTNNKLSPRDRHQQSTSATRVWMVTTNQANIAAKRQGAAGLQSHAARNSTMRNSLRLAMGLSDLSDFQERAGSEVELDALAVEVASDDVQMATGEAEVAAEGVEVAAEGAGTMSEVEALKRSVTQLQIERDSAVASAQQAEKEKSSAIAEVVAILRRSATQLQIERDSALESAQQAKKERASAVALAQQALSWLQQHEVPAGEDEKESEEESEEDGGEGGDVEKGAQRRGVDRGFVTGAEQGEGQDEEGIMSPGSDSAQSPSLDELLARTGGSDLPPSARCSSFEQPTKRKSVSDYI
uniref:EF-hand domain-containing protein n=1 Tax=Haptolina brevifila TaxID=156173 RepID=A0A7S2BTQ1_9EUKA|mmetsp:Transcript_16402/g.32998  ORF Transcript_16402/g.32998 Transcript_16402/m.32998 type:complete len:370 (+) Transcript_16402:269-1378(+)|eukprot:CAMPEP_0174703142 /NCGR_PEP_ID=MMETSP1094-20130205/7192_1 /TAXON_ID=156173 /ORGANISM="Chrysochromulina brevifilum, Strain UTEX LB 985" /LENGTH=369 /DNA_ID=CAMNT_0015901023 /DNA_START=235 /DNA_END=1344 /DNA_ORIENTATION=+